MSAPHNDFRLPFRDRSEAGRLLAIRLQPYAKLSGTLILALPRGGVPVGAAIAEALDVPLRVFVVRKLGVPGQEELAMGAITSGGLHYVNRAITSSLNIPEIIIEAAARREMQEVARREALYSRGQPLPDVRNKTIILTDDGIATGSSIRLAAQALREQGAARIIIAVPVAPPSSVLQLKEVADEVVCLVEPEPFLAVGQWYDDFHQLNDREVFEILDRLPMNAGKNG